MGTIGWFFATENLQGIATNCANGKGPRFMAFAMFVTELATGGEPPLHVKLFNYRRRREIELFFRILEVTLRGS